MQKRLVIYAFLLVISLHFLPGAIGIPDPSAQRGSTDPYQRAVGVQSRHEKDILRLPGVRGVGIGAEGQQFTLVVLFNKLGSPPPLALKIEDMPVRYYPVGELKALARPAPDNGPNHRVPQALPTPMGVSGGHALVCGGFCEGGTIGFKVCDAFTGQVGYITNNHVAAAGCPDFCPNTAAVGTVMRQPGAIDTNPTCSAGQNIGTLARFVSINFGGTNQVDGAFIASSNSQVSSTILDIGTPTTTAVDPPINASVRKSGRTTGLTIGKVTAKNVTTLIDYGSSCGGAVFNQQIVVAPDAGFPSFISSGDSGSPVTDASANPVGLAFAGDGVNGIVNPMASVLSQLNVTLTCGGSPPPPPPPPPPVTCSASAAMEGAPNTVSALNTLHQLRDNVLATSSRGQTYIGRFNQFSAEGVALMVRDSGLRLQTQGLIVHFLPVIQNIVAGQSVVLGERDLKMVDDWMNMVSPKASSSLRSALQQLRTDMRDPQVLAQFGVRIVP